jgi:hypothetical protein
MQTGFVMGFVTPSGGASSVFLAINHMPAWLLALARLDFEVLVLLVSVTSVWVGGGKGVLQSISWAGFLTAKALVSHLLLVLLSYSGLTFGLTVWVSSLGAFSSSVVPAECI